jgi:hypothetical protein
MRGTTSLRFIRVISFAMASCVLFICCLQVQNTGLAAEPQYVELTGKVKDYKVADKDPFGYEGPYFTFGLGRRVIRCAYTYMLPEGKISPAFNDVQVDWNARPEVRVSGRAEGNQIEAYVVEVKVESEWRVWYYKSWLDPVRLDPYNEKVIAWYASAGLVVWTADSLIDSCLGKVLGKKSYESLAKYQTAGAYVQGKFVRLKNQGTRLAVSRSLVPLYFTATGTVSNWKWEEKDPCEQEGPHFSFVFKPDKPIFGTGQGVKVVRRNTTRFLGRVISPLFAAADPTKSDRPTRIRMLAKVNNWGEKKPEVRAKVGKNTLTAYMIELESTDARGQKQYKFWYCTTWMDDTDDEMFNPILMKAYAGRHIGVWSHELVLPETLGKIVKPEIFKIFRKEVGPGTTPYFRLEYVVDKTMPYGYRADVWDAYNPRNQYKSFYVGPTFKGKPLR